MILIKTTTIAMTSRIWMNPPIVYPLTNPRSHSIIRITKIVQSMFILLSGLAAPHLFIDRK